MKRRTLFVVLGIAAVLAVAGVALWRVGVFQRPAPEVRTTTVERNTLLVVVSASGSVELEARVGLSFDVPGWVDEVTVEVGDRVAAGDVLARLGRAQLEVQKRQAEAARAAVEAQLAQLLSGARPEEVAAAEANLRATEAQVEAAKANLSQAVTGASDAQIAAAEAQVYAAKLQQEVAQDSHDEIVHGKGASEEQKQQAAYDLFAANEALDAARASLDELMAGADRETVQAARGRVEAAEAQADAAQAQLDLLRTEPRPEGVADLVAQIAQAQASVALIELSLESTVLRAPFDGVIAAVNVAEAELAPAGLPAVVLLDVSRFSLTVSVDEIDVGRLREGQKAEVTVDALPDAVLSGTIERISPVATLEGGVTSYDVTIELDPTDAPIRADMTANATVVVEELADVLTIPTWVVRVDRLDGQTYVDRPTEEGYERVDVDLGVRHEGVAQVLDGLAEGEAVARVEESGLFGFGGE